MSQSLKLQSERARVVEVAKSWLRTPYHHMGRVKGAGADCATLLAEVYCEAGLCLPVPIAYYPMDWNLHRSDELYLGTLSSYMKEIEESKAGPGDVVLFHFGRTWSHGAIILDWPLILHAMVGRAVSMANADNDGMIVGRKRRFFSPWSE